MKTDIRDENTLRATNPLDVLAYLRTNGWNEEQSLGEAGAYWTKVSAELLVPVDVELRDYASRIGDLLATLSELEERPQTAILTDIARTTTDVVRIRFLGDRSDTTISLGDIAGAMPNVKDMMLAAACSTIDPREHYPSL